MKLKFQKTWALPIIISAIGVMLITLSFFKNEPELVVMDMAKALEAPSILLAHSKFSPKAQEKIMQRFAKLLPDVIKSYGETHKATVISSSILVSRNARDITPIIVKNTLLRLKHDA